MFVPMEVLNATHTSLYNESYKNEKSHASLDAAQINKVRVKCWGYGAIWPIVGYWNKPFMD